MSTQRSGGRLGFLSTKLFVMFRVGKIVLEKWPGSHGANSICCILCV